MEPVRGYKLFSTSIGDCGVAWCAELVIATSLPEKTTAATASRVMARSGATVGEPPERISQAIQAITGLLEGQRMDLSFIDCDFSRLDSLAARIYRETRSIPPGETLTYGDIASRLGDKLLARAVGQLLGRNPFPIIVPCHRVVGARGQLTGFSACGGIETKQRMLAIEGAQIASQRSLFDDHG